MNGPCSLFERFASLSFMEMALFASAIVLIWVLWRIQRSPKSIDFVDLMIGPDGKASWSKMTGIGGFMVGTWVMIFDTLNARVPEGQVLLFLCYMAICVGSPVAFAVINARSGGLGRMPPNQDVHVSAPQDATVNVSTGQQPP